MDGKFEVDLYWSFRSPYSYLALPRVLQYAVQYPVKWNVRVVYPLAMRTRDHFKGMSLLARHYFLRDCERVAEHLGVPFARPVPDPIAQDPVTLEIADSQPYAHRLTLLGAEATLRGRALPVIDQVSRLLWDGSVRGWNEGGHLSRAATNAGLDLEDMEDAIAADPEPRKALIDSNQTAQQSAGHWGVPLFVFENEPFFGQDRMDLLLWRMKQRGLRPYA